jgi:heat shock protein HtpX
MPRLYVIDRPEPNAFATGRDPQHSAVAVTTGLLDLMDDRQLTGVLAHELSHVKNRDTLVGTIAATVGGAISFMSQMAQFQMLFGGGRSDNNGGSGGFGALIAIILAPIAALIIQLAVSRSREYGADASGAALTADPEGLAQALERLEAANKQSGFRARVAARMPSPYGGRSPAPAPAANPAFASLYIVNPLSGRQVAGLFSTHPPIEDRVARLRRMALRGWSGA